jgi:DNA-binding transcriptional ArsR family regulator
MEEVRYRESRLCRLLGNPVVYQIVTLLAKNGPLTPARLGALSERSVQTISGHLATLRTADVVRYETRGRQTRYWLKHPKDVEGLLRALEKVVRTSTGLKSVYDLSGIPERWKFGAEGMMKPPKGSF